MEPILLRTLRCTGLHANGRIFGQAVVDDFVRRSVNLLKRRESGSTHVNINSWNKTMKTVDSCALEREVREAVGMINPRGCTHKEGQWFKV